MPFYFSRAHRSPWPRCQEKYVGVLLKESKRAKRERERGAHSRRGVGIVRFARGDNLQEMAEMDWQSMFFSPIEKSPSRGNRERVRVFY